MAIQLSCLLCTSGRRFVSLLLYLCIVGAKTQHSKIKCSIEPVKLLQDTVLTCNFPEDLNVTRKEFTVYHYNKGPDSDHVLDCWWPKGSLLCTTTSGIKFNDIVSRSIKLTISNVTSEHTGKYACQVNGYDASDFETCDLELKNGSDSSCDITYNRSESKAMLTCFSNKNDTVRQGNITVYKHVGKDKEAVAECTWEDGQPRCRMEKGYLFNDDVSSYISIWILEATNDPAGSYSCWHTGSNNNLLDTCSLYAYDTGNQTDHSLKIGLTLGLLLLAALITTGIFMFLRHKRNKSLLCFMATRNTEEQGGEGGRPMLGQKPGQWAKSGDRVTEQFKEYLLNKVNAMYPKILQTFHFVPPVYFNRGRYQKQCLSGHDVYVPDPPDPRDVRHDQAMQRVLHCMRHMAERYQEQMFVLTQFKYEDYLKRPIPRYKRNHLPMPSDLKGVDKSVGCFDILIVHRYQGVLVLVVKDVESQEPNKAVFTQLTGGLKQLKLANCMIKHLLKDMQKIPKIQQAVILPNFSNQLLSQVLRRSTSLIENIREFLERRDSNDPIELFLCAEHLSTPEKPWDVPGDVVQHVRNWWNKLMGAAPTDEVMTDDIYLNMIARFCGPATQSTLQATDGYKRLVLPQTLAEAVSLTGDLYRRQVLYPDMIDLLKEPKVFLAGPRSTGKTTMLTITGTKWLKSGKNVFIVKDTSSLGCHFLSHIYEPLEKALATQSSSGRRHGEVIHIDCDFRSEQDRKSRIDEIKGKTKDTKKLYVLIEAHLEGKYVKLFCENLHDAAKAKDICLWIVSNDSNNNPVVGYSHGHILTTALNCPPAVVREVRQRNNLKYSQEYKFPPPSDGPPVIHVYHSVEDHNEESHSCSTCGKEVGNFLSELFSEQESVTQEPKHPDKRNLMAVTTIRGSPLRYKDILIVLESSLEDSDFLVALRKLNIPVRTLRIEDNKVVSTDDDKAAMAISVSHMQIYRPKRKIVVYVETAEEHDCSENKERALTSCTSQLVLVHSKKS